MPSYPELALCDMLEQPEGDFCAPRPGPTKVLYCLLNPWTHCRSSWASQSLRLSAFECLWRDPHMLRWSQYDVCLPVIFILLFNVTLSLCSSKYFESRLHCFPASADMCLLWKWPKFLVRKSLQDWPLTAECVLDIPQR